MIYEFKWQRILPISDLSADLSAGVLTKAEIVGIDHTPRNSMAKPFKRFL
jgi:hypothetical protein